VVLGNRLVAEYPAGTTGAGLVILTPAADDIGAWRRLVEASHAHGVRVGVRLAAGDVARAARLAAEVGVDLLELDLERLRVPLEAFDAARAAWPGGRPIGARVGADDPDAVLALARALAQRGCDLVALAGRADRAGVALTSLSDRVRHEVGVATVVAAGSGTSADVNSILAAGRADLCLVA
jgi:2,4-dienoyl-CoA reductase-like NADH-dependent reductase (Old Yellow Enzyme family)